MSDMICDLQNENITKEQDTVIFMSAYDVHKFNKKIPKIWHKTNIKDLLKKFHIFGLSSQERILTNSVKTKYTTVYDHINHTSKFEFHFSDDKYSNDVQSELNEMINSLMFHHSARTLLDTTKTNIDHCFNLDSFLVTIDSEVFQVDPLAYFFNGVLIINFELIHFDTGLPFSYDEIYGRKNNFNILPIQSVKYFDEENFSDDNRRIPDIIFENIWGFLNEINRYKYSIDKFTFVHNILVFSNNVSKPDDYFKKVLGAQSIELSIKDIGPSNDFDYYSKEYLALTTAYDINNISNIIVDIQVLESLKVFILLQMIIDVEINDKLNILIDHQIYLQALSYQSNVPIITLNLIDSLRTMFSYNQYKSAVEFKIEALKILQDRDRTKNGRFLNILLYILALIGSFQTLDVLEEQFDISFSWGMVFICVIFGLLGVVWWTRDNKN